MGRGATLLDSIENIEGQENTLTNMKALGREYTGKTALLKVVGEVCIFEGLVSKMFNLLCQKPSQHQF